MSNTSVFGQAVIGANNPTQTTSTQQGFYESPGPFFKAMNQNTVTDISVLSSGSVGTFLQRRGVVNGDIATIINATLDYVLGGKSKSLPPLSPNVKTTNTKRTFIPIIIKTDFNYTSIYKTDNASNSIPVSIPTPLYIIFDSTPEDITFTKTANWESKNFLGRPEPVWTYANSSATTFSLTGKFYAESFQAHGRLLRLSDYIMSLVTPSEMNYMPSPVTLFIGQWKELRCIVNNVTVKHMGPWAIQLTETDLSNAQTQASADAITNAMKVNSGPGSIPSHAPYLFEATFSFTVVGKDNEVKYAEQIISSGSSNSSDLITTDAFQESALNRSLGINTQSTIPKTINTGLYGLSSETKYTFINGQIQTAVNSNIDYTSAASTLNLYDNANNVKRLSDQGIISNAISSQMLSLFQKANPTSTNTPATSNSLNPFKKLF